MSLGCLYSNGTMQTSGTTDSQQIEWCLNGYVTDTSLNNYDTCDGSNDRGFVQYQANSGSTALSYINTPHIAYPYTDLTATEHNVISTGSLSDYDGVGNTNKLYAYAANACKNFYTVGTSAGDWYLPAEGELAYLPSIMYQVNDTISALNTKYGNVGLQLGMSKAYWSSSECNTNTAWLVNPTSGIVGNGNKSGRYCVRAFLRF